MSKLLKATILVLVVFSLLASPVLAYLFRAQIAITEANGNAYTMLPVMVNANNDWMASNGFMEADALDTRVQTLGGLNRPHMVSDNITLTATAVPANSQTNLYFVTGETDLSAMDIIVGYDGYITTTDAAALECGNNFEIEIDGYFDTSVVGGELFEKTDALRAYVSAASSVRAVIYTPTTESQALRDGSEDLYNGDDTRAGQRVNSFPISTITEVQLMLAKGGAPTGTGYCRVRRVSDDAVLGTIGTIDVATVGVGYAFFTFNTTPVENTASQDLRIVFEYSGGDAANRVFVGTKVANVTAFGQWTEYQAGWTDFGAEDASFHITYLEEGADVTAAGVTSGEHIIGVSANTTDLLIEVDGTLEDFDLLGGVSVTDNANDWEIVRDNAVVYMNSYEHTVAGTLIVHYEPIDIIATTVLPDREGAAQNGAITWGSNPAGVSVTIGSLESSGQPTIGVTDIEDTPVSILPAVVVSDWYGDGTVSGGTLTNPWRPFITMVSDNTTITEIQVWRFMGVVAMLFAGVASLSLLRGHLGISAIIVAAVMGGLVAFDNNIFPLWVLVISVVMFIGGIVAERSPTL